MGLRGGNTIRPLTGLSDTTTGQRYLKHYFPCDSVVGGNIVDSVGSVIAAPQSGASFVYNATEKSVLATTTDQTDPVVLASGAWEVFPANVAALFMCAGYFDSTYNSSRYTIRCALGDANNLLPGSNGQGWGMADGTFAANGQAALTHVSLHGVSSDSAIYSSTSTDAFGMPGKVPGVAQDTYFIRYALYKPGVVQMESKIFDETGLTTLANDDAVSATTDVGGAQFFNAFRMAGFRCTGIALYYFDSATPPSDYLTMVYWNGGAWKNGIKQVYASGNWK